MLLTNLAHADFIGSLEQISPVATTYTLGVDFNVFLDNGNAAVGDVTAPVGTALSDGCTPSDYFAFVAGDISLVQRGVCTFSNKAIIAAEAGAVGILIYDNVIEPANSEMVMLSPTSIPALFLTENLGLSLGSITAPLEIHMTVGRAAVPEPTTLALLGIALAGLAGTCRRKPLPKVVLEVRAALGGRDVRRERFSGGRYFTAARRPKR
jgi:hypothetical protein